MLSHVNFQGFLLGESSFTLVAGPGFNTGMCLYVPFQVAFGRKSGVAEVTPKRFLSCVPPSVNHKIAFASKPLFAPLALERFGVLPPMTSEPRRSDVGLAAEFALVDNFVGTVGTTSRHSVHRLVHWGRVAIDGDAFNALHGFSYLLLFLFLATSIVLLLNLDVHFVPESILTGDCNLLLSFLAHNDNMTR